MVTAPETTLRRRGKARSIPTHHSTYSRAAGIGLVRLLVLGPVFAQVSCARREAEQDWRANWAVEDGFALDVDTEGYHFPSAIAFVPNPGPAPDDPLYFVTELRGKVKVVTNDRRTYTFAEDFVVSRPRKELPDIEGETGLAGICLDPKRGFVFVTYAYADSVGTLRNAIVRFLSKPGTFARSPVSSETLPGIFDGYEVVPSHQVGGCQVDGDLLYVSVADGRQTARSQDTSSVLGKILRMTVDGRPAPDNPFYRNADATQGANLVWSYGLRNPFGIRVVEGKVIVADNGSGIDRIIEARRATNYLYDGSDGSIGTKALTVLAPSVGPAQVEYVGQGSSALPARYHRTLFIATSSVRSAGVIALGYDPQMGAVFTPPREFVRYVGKPGQVVVGVAAGPDGLYLVPLMPDAAGRSAVLRVHYQPQQSHPVRIADTRTADDLLVAQGCIGCHSLEGEGGTVGPPLDRDDLVRRIRERLESDEYAPAVRALDAVNEEPFRSYRAARAEVLAERGEQRVATWIRYRIMEPRFDDPHAQMPNVGLSDAQARLITRHLVQKPGRRERMKAAVKGMLPARPRHRHLVVFAAAGALSGVGASLLAALVYGAVRRRRRASRRADRGTLPEK